MKTHQISNRSLLERNLSSPTSEPLDDAVVLPTVLVSQSCRTRSKIHLPLDDDADCCTQSAKRLHLLDMQSSLNVSKTNDTTYQPRVTKSECSSDIVSSSAGNLLSPKLTIQQESQRCTTDSDSNTPAILHGVVAYVEVRSGNENRSRAVSRELLNLGAEIEHFFSDRVTHVVFKDGQKRTYDRAVKLGRHLVSVLWVESCKQQQSHVSEVQFTLVKTTEGSTTAPPKRWKKTKSMQPKDFHEELASSAEKVEKRKRRQPLPSERVFVCDTPEMKDDDDKLERLRRIVSSPLSSCAVVPETPAVHLLAGVLRTNRKLPIATLNESFEQDSSATHRNIVHVGDNEKLVDGVTQQSRLSDGNDADKQQKRKRCSLGVTGSLVKKVRTSSDTGTVATVNLNAVAASQNPASSSLLTSNKLSCSSKEAGVVVDSNVPACPVELLNKVNSKNLFLPTSEENTAGTKKISNKSRVMSKFSITSANVDATVTDSRIANSRSKSMSDCNCTEKNIGSGLQETCCSCSVADDSILRNSTGRNTGELTSKSRDVCRAGVKTGQSRTLVTTSLHRDEQLEVNGAVDTLGNFLVSEQFSCQTTHVVCGAQRRTLNLLQAIVHGCWVLSYDWVLQSVAAGHWLDEEEFELASLFPAVKVSRTARQEAGSEYRCHIFDKCGKIFVTASTLPPRDDLVQLVTCAGGTLTNNFRTADLIVGRAPGSPSNSVRETWILDSIMAYQCLLYNEYKWENERT